MESKKTEVKDIPSLMTIDVLPIENDTPAHYWNFCVNCGTPLDSRKCKLFCPKCGFYHNCSEP